MATSQYSILRQYTPYTTPYNIDLIKDVMVYKQGQVDANRARMNQQMDYLMGQQIDKPEAREYMQNKMMGIIDRVNDMYRGADLSSDGITRSIQGEISSVLDSTVMNAIAGSKEGRRMQEYISDLKLNHPELYSPVNEYAAMKPYYEWVNDGNAGSRLGSLSYIPYTDYNKEMRTAMDSIMKLHKGQKIQRPVLDKDGNPTGQMMEITRDVMTPQQEASIAMSSLSQNALNQMHMEAAYMADMNPNQFSFNSIMAFNQQSVMNQEDYIRSLEAKLAGAGSDNELAKNIQNELNGAKRDLTEMKKNLASLTPDNYNPAMGAQMVVENTFKQNAANMYSYDNSSITIGKDEVYWAQKDYELKARNFNLQNDKLALALKKMEFDMNKERYQQGYRELQDEREYGLDMERLKIQRDKIAMQAAKGLTGRAAGQAADAAIRQLMNPTGGVITYESIQTEDSAIRDFFDKYSEDTYTPMRIAGEQLKNSLGKQNVDKINSYIKERLKDPTSGYQGLTSDEQFFKYFKENGALTNSMFDEIGSKSRSIAMDAYQTMIRMESRSDVINDRLNEESALSDTIVIDYGNKLLNEYSNYNDNDAKNLATRDILAATIYDVLGDRMNNENAVNSNGIVVPTFSSAEISELRNRISSISLFLKGDRTAWNDEFDSLIKQDKNTGRYFLDIKSHRSYSNPSIIPDRDVIDGSLASYIRSSLTNYGLNSVEKYDNAIRRAKKLHGDSFGDGLYQEGIKNIRLKYMNFMANPSQTYRTDYSEKDPRREISKNLGSLFAAKVAKIEDGKLPSSITHYTYTKSNLKADDGGVMYEITAHFPGTDSNEKSTRTVLVSERELVNTGAESMQDREWENIGDYDSGLMSPTFASSSSSYYPKLLERNGINPAYATKATTLKLITDIINEKQFPGDQKSVDGSLIKVDQRKLDLINAAKTIMDNYNKFKTDKKGYDEGGGDMGYFVNLYDISGGKPEKIASMDNPGIVYADDARRMDSIAPQTSFIDLLSVYIANEIDNMIKYGAEGIDPEGNLSKMLNVVRGTEGGQDNG